MTSWCFSVTKLLSCTTTQEIQPSRSICQKFEIIIGPTVNEILNMCPYNGQKINIYLHLRGYEIRLTEQWCCQRVERIKQLYGDWWSCVVKRGSGVFSVRQADKLCHLRSQGSNNLFFIVRGVGGGWSCLSGLRDKWSNGKSISFAVNGFVCIRLLFCIYI